jgi:ComF family protein
MQENPAETAGLYARQPGRNGQAICKTTRPERPGYIQTDPLPTVNVAGDMDSKSLQDSRPVQGLFERAKQAVRGLPRAALDLAFPPTCVACDHELTREATNGGAPFCPPCIDELAWKKGVACPRCAAPLQVSAVTQRDDELPIGDAIAWVKPTPRDCLRCRGRRYGFQAAIAAGRYAGRLRELVLQMKRADQNWVSLAMGELVWQCCREQLAAAGADVVAPIPLHWRRRMAHGTNSAALLAEVIARRLGAPLATGLLRRSRNTPPQFSLSPPERRANVRGAFSFRGGYPIEKANVLLVDDIMTSGATANEAARMLRQAGAKRVTVVVAARAVS